MVDIGEAFCVAPQPFGLGYRVDDIDRIIGERKANSARERAEKAKPVGPVGAPAGNKNAARVEPQSVADLPLMKAAAENKGSVSTIVPKRDADYLTARIARDRPDILERMKAGEYPSVRKAALEAGIIRPEFSCPCDPGGEPEPETGNSPQSYSLTLMRVAGGPHPIPSHSDHVLGTTKMMPPR